MDMQTQNKVIVRVEIFGHARSVTGVHHVRIEIPSESNTRNLAVALADALPALVSIALNEDGSALLSSYTANLNGLAFIGDEPVAISPGDCIYLFSSQAGG